MIFLQLVWTSDAKSPDELFLPGLKRSARFNAGRRFGGTATNIRRLADVANPMSKERVAMSAQSNYFECCRQKNNVEQQDLFRPYVDGS